MGLRITDKADKVRPFIIIVVLPVIAILLTFAQNESLERAFMMPSVSGELETPDVAYTIGAEGEEEEDITENRMIMPLQDNYIRQHDSSAYGKNTKELRAMAATDLNALSDKNSASPEPDSLSSFATCNKLSVSSITANGNDGNKPTNAIDNNLDTRWSNNGIGSWIQLDLGSKKSICSVDIAWYRGTVRQNNFVISVSSDGTNFANKFSGQSSGNTLALEKYNLPAGTEGRYIRITVNGNTENNWASITEIAAHGGPVSTGTVKGTLYHKWQASPSSSNSWSVWKDIGGGGRGDPVVAQNKDGRLEVFAVDLVDNYLWHQWQKKAGDSQSWSGWTRLGSTITIKGDPIIAKNTDGRLEIFAVNAANNQLYHKWQTIAGNSNSWSIWHNIGSAITIRGEPVIASNSDGRLEVFVVNAANNQVYHKWQTSAGSSNSWSWWKNLGSAITIRGEPVIASNSDGRLEVFALNAANNQVYHKWQTSAGSNSWSWWKNLGSAITTRGNPIVAKNPDGRLEVFAVNAANNQLYHKWQTSAGSSSSWSLWYNTGSAITIRGDPVIGKNSDGRLEVFAINAANNQLYHKWQTSAGSSNSWSAWENIGSAITIRGEPVISINSDGRLEVFAINAANNQLYHKWQTSAGSSSWSAWENIGSAITIRGGPVISINSDGRLEVFAVKPESDNISGGDAGQLDKFGMKKFYNSKVNGQQWYLGDPGLITGGVTIAKPSYYYETTSTQVRLRVAPPSSGYHPEQISTLDQNQLTSKGYMQSPYDWKNVEITGRFRVVSYTDSTTNGAAHIELSARGGTHTSSAPCEGTAYHGNLYVTGRSKFEKELMHTGGYATNNPQKVDAVGPLQGKWFDFKHVIYTLPSGHIKVEQYYQENVDGQWSGWKKIFEHTDTGTWGGGTNNCGGTSYQMIKWGGPLVFFRWDNIDKMHFYNLSVREIVPP
jgi:hypothetical protein